MTFLELEQTLKPSVLFSNFMDVKVMIQESKPMNKSPIQLWAKIQLETRAPHRLGSHC